MYKFAAILLPVALLLLNAANIFLGEHRSERNVVAKQERAEQNRMSGKWRIDVPAGGDKGRLQLAQQNSDDWGAMHVPLAQFRGINVDSGARHSFALVRDAGTFSFTGSFQSGRGQGEWTFKGSAGFATELRNHGYDQFSEEQLYTLALNDVHSAYITELARAGYRNLSVNELISLYSNNVRAAYITSLESVGYARLSIRDLLALKTNGVTDAYIKSLQTRGYSNLSVQRILSLRTNPGNQH
jgi:hypothetical protein